MLIFLLASSCYERQEGCLDIRSDSYDFFADDPCEDCCTYPTMTWQVTHEWLDTFLMEGEIYYNNLDQYIQVISSEFYISELALLKENEEFVIDEVLEVVDKAGAALTISNSIQFVQSFRKSYPVGSFRYPDTYDALGFTLGIPGNYVASDSTETFVEDVSFLDEEICEHTNFRLEYVVDTISMDTLVMELIGTSTIEEISLEALNEVPLSEDFTISIIARYDLLFNDIDLQNLESDVEKVKLQAKLSEMFSY